MKRREFAKISLATAGAIFPLHSMLARKAFGLAPQGVPLPGNQIPQFVDPLPDLQLLDGTAGQILLSMDEHKFPMMPTGFVGAGGNYAGTWVWGYRHEDSLPNVHPHIGPVILAKRGVPTEVKYVNNLGSPATHRVFWEDWTDQTLHWANPGGADMVMGNTAHYTGAVPAVPHLHGGEVPPELDGGPDAWFTSDGNYVGHAFYSKGWDGVTPQNYCIYRYPNSQEAANIWFHDHALGITRLNVYAGIAGAYLLRDDSLSLPTGLTAYGIGDETIIPLVIQDRMFDTNGQLYFPNVGINPDHPYWVPEFVGDTIVVNGKVWPYKAVDRKRYRMLFLNGSNARAYDMSLIDRVTSVRGPRMWVIGTDGGYLDAPVLIDPNATGQQSRQGISKSLVVMPGERYDVIVDFNDPAWVAAITAAYGGTVPATLNLELQNTARTPFPGGGPAPKGTTGRVIQFRVNWGNTPADTGYDPASAAPLRSGTRQIVRLVDPMAGTMAAGVTVNKTRQLTLNEIMGPGGPLEVLVNNTKWSGHSPRTYGDFSHDAGSDTYYSELPQEGETELWEIINLTADAHPIHLHLVQFQLMNRQTFDVGGYNAAYNAAFPGIPTEQVGGMFLPAFGPPLNYNTANGDNAVGGNPAVSPFLNNKKWPATPPMDYERGWKDTVIMYPGQVTRIMVRWAPTDLSAGTASDSAGAAFPFSPDGGHGYVWHCHIIDHEDNEMMRPDKVTPNAGATRTYLKGTASDNY